MTIRVWWPAMPSDAVHCRVSLGNQPAFDLVHKPRTDLPHCSLLAWTGGEEGGENRVCRGRALSRMHVKPFGHDEA